MILHNMFLFWAVCFYHVYRFDFAVSRYIVASLDFGNL